MRIRGWVGVLLLLCVSTGVFAAGTLVYEQGSKASAMAGAFVAQADDPSAVFYNPAGIVFQQGMQFSVNMTYINADVKFKSATLGTFKNNAKNFFIPAVFFTMPITDKITFGLSSTAPYNLATDWSDSFPGRFASRHSKIVTYDIRPVLAFRINERQAVSVGLDYYDCRINLIRSLNTSALSTAVNPNRLPSPPFPPGIPLYSYSEGSVDTHLRDQAWGFNLGYLYKNAPWSVGLFYHSKPTFNFKGHTSIEVDPKLAPYSAAFASQEVKLDLNAVPANARFGVAYNGDPLTVEFDVTWQQWSSWGRSTAHFSNPTFFFGTPVVEDETFVFDWKDSYTYRLGFNYKMNDNYNMYWGILFDQGPVPDETRNPTLPDEDRWSLTFGTGYHKGNFALDWYAMYLKWKKANITATNMFRYGETGLPLVVVPVYGQLYPTTYPIQGNDSHYNGVAYLFGIQFSYKF